MRRDEAEQNVARALSRHIGYTSGAYDLPRIFEVVKYFQKRTSAYAEEIVSYLAERSESNAASPEYLAEVINFASSFGMVEAVSTREAKLTRYAATELGRSILGAFATDDEKFQSFFIVNVALLADADFLVPLMMHIADPTPSPLFEYFCAFAATLRERRYEWMKEAFPQPILFERIATQIPWLKKSKRGPTAYTVDIPSLNTARHHSRPRMGWLAELGLSDSNSTTLTRFGADVVRALVGDCPYFWISPGTETLTALALSDPAPSASEVDLRLSAECPTPDRDEIQSLTADVAAVMKRAYSSAKLVHAEQASLRLPIAYIQYRSYRDQLGYNWRVILDLVFDLNRGTLQRYSAHKGQIGFYKLVDA